MSAPFSLLRDHPIDQGRRNCPGATRAGSAISEVPPGGSGNSCNPSFSFYEIGSRTQWNPAPQLVTPRIWLESSVVIPTNRVRAATSVRVSMLSKPFTRTARKNPTSASQTIGVVRVRLVCRHIERRLCMARIDADRRQPLGAKGMIEPYRQRSGLEHYPFHGWRPLADKLGDEARIRCALATPDPFTCSADRDCRLFHRHVQTNIFFHGCSPFGAWARVESRPFSILSRNSHPPSYDWL